MFHEEKIIDGKLMFRTTPDGEWQEATTATAKAVNALLALTEEQRIRAISFFCKHCGDENPHCHCMNDD